MIDKSQVEEFLVCAYIIFFEDNYNLQFQHYKIDNEIKKIAFVMTVNMLLKILQLLKHLLIIIILKLYFVLIYIMAILNVWCMIWKWTKEKDIIFMNIKQ